MMEKKLTKYENLRKVIISLGCCSGAIGNENLGGITTEGYLDWAEVCLATDGGITENELNAMDIACGVLSEEEQLVLVDGDEKEKDLLIDKMNAFEMNGVGIGTMLDGLLEDIFESE